MLKGMRFHLPAFLTADLRGEFGFHLTFHLTDLSDFALTKLTLLSPAQRKVVEKYLLCVMDEPNYALDRLNIENALLSYWMAT
jgi:hypothetical protein